MTSAENANLRSLLDHEDVAVRRQGREANASLDPDERLADPVGERTAELVALNPWIPPEQHAALDEYAFQTVPQQVVSLALWELAEKVDDAAKTSGQTLRMRRAKDSIIWPA